MLQKYQWLFMSNGGEAQKDQYKLISIIPHEQLQHMSSSWCILFLQE